LIDANLLDRDAQIEPSPSVRREPLPLIAASKRPLWRIAAGASAAGVGVILIGFGISAFVQNGVVLDGSCPTSLGTKRCQFGTTVPGIGLTVTGALLAGAGVGLLAWPPPKAKPQISLFGSPSGGLVLDTSF
jgi:hypothetical protein